MTHWYDDSGVPRLLGHVHPTATEGTAVFDLERLNRALAYIEAHPERHMQSAWLVKLTCGTGGCIAGWVTMEEYPAGTPEGFLVEGHLGETYSRLNVGDRTVEVPDEAASLLGVTAAQSDVLFYGNNTLGDLKAMRDALAANPTAPASDLMRVASWRDDEGLNELVAFEREHPEAAVR